MQKLDDELQGLNEKVDEIKEKVKEGAREVERLRIERSDVEKLAKTAREEVEDNRVIGLYDWQVAPLCISLVHSSTSQQVYCVARITSLAPFSGVLPLCIRE